MLNTKPEFVQFAIHKHRFLYKSRCTKFYNLVITNYNNNIVMDKLKSFIFNQQNNTSI